MPAAPPLLSATADKGETRGQARYSMLVVCDSALTLGARWFIGGKRLFAFVAAGGKITA